MAEGKEMSLEKAMETWDGTWQYVLTLEDPRTEKTHFLEWFDTQEEAIKKLLEITDGVKAEHPEYDVGIICHNKYAYIDIDRSEWDFDRYNLRVWEQRTCVKDLVEPCNENPVDRVLEICV